MVKKTPENTANPPEASKGESSERAVMSEFTSNPDVMRRVSELARKDPRLAELRAQLIRSASGDTDQDPKTIISASITVLTNMAIRGGQEVGQEALTARDNLVDLAHNLAPTQKGRKR